MAAAKVLAPAAEPAFVQAEAAWILLVGAALVFALVAGLLAWIVATRRESRAPGETGGAAAVPTRWWLVGGGLALPLALLVPLFLYAVLRTGDSVPGGSTGARPGDLVVSVTGWSWWWDVRYRDPQTGATFALSNEIHLPSGRHAVLGLEGGDVIHSFWAPSLAGKVDLIPGRVQQLRVVPATPGVYRAPCAEFCGAQHARMALEVTVHEPAAFEAWLAAEARPASAAPREPIAERGRALFAEAGCAACHAVRGLHDGGGAGPDLTHAGRRRWIGAGTLAADRAGFRAWLVDLQHVKKGARMPSYDHLPPADVDALAAFLASLR
jgi:cytochrome c oxidase subunit 2